MIEEEDAPCDICRTTEVEQEDRIIFCDKCDVAVHQGCYGVENIPSDSWFCKTCDNNVQPTCVFCQQKKGAMKNTVDGRWAHVSCTLWIPEVNFANPETMDNIQNLDMIPKSRWGLSCFICRKKGGACIQCYVPSCKTAYHVTCGYNNGLHMRMEDVVTSDSEIIFESFCRRHSGKMSSIGKPKKKKRQNSNDDEIFVQFLPNTKSKDATTKAHRDSQFRSYLEGLKKEMKSNLQRNITEVNVLSEELEKNVEPQSPSGPNKNASGPNTINNGNGDIAVEKDFSFNLINTENENEQENQTVEKVSEQAATHNENGNQTIENETEDLNDVSNRTYIGTTLVAKATARKSCPKKQGITHNNKVTKMKHLKDFLPKTVKAPKVRSKPKAKVAKPKNSPKRKANQSSANKVLKTPPAKSPKLEKQTQSKITLNNLIAENVSLQNCDQKLSSESKPIAMPSNCPPWLSPPRSSSQWSTSMEVAAMVQNHPSFSTEIGVPMSSNSHNLNAFLGYLASLLQSLPTKKSLKVQSKLITQVLKEHNLSSSSDDISDVSSLSD